MARGVVVVRAVVCVVVVHAVVGGGALRALTMALGRGGPRHLPPRGRLDARLDFPTAHRELQKLLRAAAQRALELAVLVAARAILIARRPPVRRLEGCLPHS